MKMMLIIKKVFSFLIFISCLYGINPKATLASEHLPIIFAHGLGAPPLFYETVIPLKEFFKARGYDLYIAHTPVGGSFEERAQILYKEINDFLPHQERFHLVGHSMGGLDSRLVVQKYGLGSRCVSITTIATPHKGSPAADFLAKNFRWISTFLSFFSTDIQTLLQLRTDWMQNVFNQEVKNDPRVKYFSLGFYIPQPVEVHSNIPFFWLTHSILSQAGQFDNDGMVSVESARWGEFLGAWPADHYSETGGGSVVGGIDYNEVFQVIISNLNAQFP